MVSVYLERSGLLGLSSKRGCPHACTYCTYPAIEGAGFAARDPREVAEEAERLGREFGAADFFFTDSIFNDPEGHYLSLAEEFCRRGLKVRWCAFFRHQGLGEEALALLARAGLYGAELGTDATSDATLAGLREGFSFAEVVAAGRDFAARGIPSAHYVMFGGPEETEATLEEGFANLERLERAVVFAFSGIRLFPGTALHRRAVAEGGVAADHDLLHPAYFISPGPRPGGHEQPHRGGVPREAHLVLPAPEGHARSRQLRAMGFKGLLWDHLVRSDWRRRGRAEGGRS